MTLVESSERRTVLEVAGLAKDFPVRTGRTRRLLKAVDGVDLTLSDGETLGLVGESGSGKSTLARLIARLVDPTAGSVRLDGTDLVGLSGRRLREARASFQMVFQDPYSSFDPTSQLLGSVLEPLENHRGRLSAAERRARIDELFRLVSLDPAYATRRPGELSGGQLQRAAIARGLSTQPRVLLLDEPVSALDVSTQAQVVNVLVDLRKRLDVAMVFIAHDLAVVRHVSDRVAVMYLGRIVEQGPADRVYGSPRHPYTSALLSAVPVANPRVQRSRKRQVLGGEIPSALALPAGCRFSTRCPQVMDVCRDVAPSRALMPDGVVVECHLHAPAAATSSSTTDATTPAA